MDDTIQSLETTIDELQDKIADLENDLDNMTGERDSMLELCEDVADALDSLTLKIRNGI